MTLNPLAPCASQQNLWYGGTCSGNKVWPFFQIEHEAASSSSSSSAISTDEKCTSMDHINSDYQEY